jgi:hypothetical protein
VGFESAHSFRWPLWGATAPKLSNPEVLEELDSPNCKAVTVKERSPVIAGMKLSDRLLLHDDHSNVGQRDFWIFLTSDVK